MSKNMDANAETVPEFDLADRMRKSLRHSDLSVQGMADYLGVSRNTVGTWINGRIVPGTQTLRLWAMKTNVPYEWLRDGTPRAPAAPGSSVPRIPRMPLGIGGPSEGEHG